MLICFTKFLERRTWREAALLSMVMTVSLFTHYGLAFLVLSLNGVFSIVFILKKAYTRSTLWKWLVIQVAPIIGVFLVYQIALHSQFEYGGYGSTGYLASGYWGGGSLLSAIGFLYSRTRNLIDMAFPIYIFTVILYLGIIVLFIIHRNSKLPLLLGIPFIVVGFASLLGIYPYGGTRHNLFLTPLIYLLVGLGMEYSWRVDRNKIIFGLLLVLFVRKAPPLIQAYYDSPGESGVGFIVRTLSDISTPADPIYVCLGDDPTVQYYLELRYPIEGNPIVEGVRGPGPRDYIDQVDIMLEEYQHAWMLILNGCGDMTPLLDHVRAEWNVELVERRYPDAQLYYVDR